MKTSDIPDMAGLYPADTSQKPVTKEKNLPVFQRQLKQKRALAKGTFQRRLEKLTETLTTSSIFLYHLKSCRKTI